MKSMSWLLYEDDYIPHECLSCGFITRSPSIYRRHSRLCADLPAKSGPSSLAAIQPHDTNQLLKYGDQEAILCDVLTSVVPAETNFKKEHDMVASCDDAASESVGQKSCRSLEILSAEQVDLQVVCTDVERQNNSVSTVIGAQITSARVVTSDEGSHQSCPVINDSVSTVHGVELAAAVTMKIDSIRSNDRSSISDQNCRSDYSITANANNDLENTSCDSQTDDNNRDLATSNNQPITDLTNGTAQTVVDKVKSGGGKMYECSRCDFSTCTKAERRAHTRTAHSAMRRVHQCNDCGYHSSQHKNLLRHMERHLLDGPFKCNLCTYSSTSLSAVRKHTLFNHNDSANEILSARTESCTDAREIVSESCLKNAANVSEHACQFSTGGNAKTNRGSESESNEGLDAESVVNFVDKTLISAKSAMKLVKNIVKSKESNITVQVEQILDSSDSELWTCFSCGMSYQERAKIRRHVKTKHHVSLSVCQLVDKRNTTPANHFNAASHGLQQLSKLSSEASFSLEELPSSDNIPQKLIKKHKINRKLLNYQVSTPHSVVEDNITVARNSDPTFLTNTLSESSCFSRVKKRKMIKKSTSSKLKAVSIASISKEDESQTLSGEIDSQLSQSGSTAEDSVPSPKKMKKLMALQQSCSSLADSVPVPSPKNKTQLILPRSSILAEGSVSSQKKMKKLILQQSSSFTADSVPSSKKLKKLAFLQSSLLAAESVQSPKKMKKLVFQQSRSPTAGSVPSPKKMMKLVPQQSGLLAADFVPSPKKLKKLVSQHPNPLAAHSVPSSKKQKNLVLQQSSLSATDVAPSPKKLVLQQSGSSAADLVPSAKKLVKLVLQQSSSSTIDAAPSPKKLKKLIPQQSGLSAADLVPSAKTLMKLVLQQSSSSATDAAPSPKKLKKLIPQQSGLSAADLVPSSKTLMKLVLQQSSSLAADSVPSPKQIKKLLLSQSSLSVADLVPSSKNIVLQQSSSSTVDAVSLPKKIKKIVLFKQNATSMKMREDQKKNLVKSQKEVVRLATDEVTSQTRVFQSNKETNISKSSQPEIAKHVAESTHQFKSVLDTPQRSQRPHFCELVKSIKSDDSSNPVKVKKIASLTVSPLLSELNLSSRSSEVNTNIPAQAHKLVRKKTKSELFRRKNKLATMVKLASKLEDGLGESLNQCREACENSSKLINSSELLPEDDDADSISSQPLRCAHCSYCSNRLSVLRRHLLSHVTERRYACDRCSRKYKHEWSLTLHQRHAHKKASCRGSEESTSSKDLKVSKTVDKSGRGLHKLVKRPKKNGLSENDAKLNKRLTVNHKPEDIEVDGNNLENLADTKNCSDKKLLTLTGLLVKCDVKSVQVDLKPSESVDGLKCRYCDFVGNLASHMPIHAGNRKYRCPLELCFYKSNWACDMKKHVKKYHADFLNSNGYPSLRDVIKKSVDRVSGKAAIVYRLTSKKGKTPRTNIAHQVDHEYENNLTNGTETLFHRKKLILPVGVDPDDDIYSGKVAAAAPCSQNIGRRKIPVAERCRPYKCSVCGKRSNWRWDIMKHLRLVHSDNHDAHLVVLSTDVARTTLKEMFRRPKTYHARNTTASTRIVNEEGSAADETAVNESSNSSMLLSDVLDSVAQGRDAVSHSIGVFDVLRLKRFRCSGCPYRSNHRTDIGRHIRYQHGRGKCKVEVLSADVASETLLSYTLSQKRSSRNVSDASNKIMHYKSRKEIKQRSAENIPTVGESLAGSKTDDLEEHVKLTDTALNAADNSRVSDHIAPTVEENSWRRRFRDTTILEYEDMAKCCDICPFRTDRTGLLALHKLRHRAPSTKASKTTQLLYTCPHCPYFVHTSRQLERHVVLHDVLNATHLDPIVTTTLPGVGNERYVCENCPFVTVHRSDFWVHRRMHLGPGANGPVQKCELCMFWTSDKRTMLEHVGLHTLCYYPSFVHQSDIGCEIPVSRVDAALADENLKLVQYNGEVKPVMEFKCSSYETESVLEVTSALCCSESNKNNSVVESVYARSSDVIDQAVIQVVCDGRPVPNEILDQQVNISDQSVIEVVKEGSLVSSEIVYESVVEAVRSSNPVIKEILDQLLVEVERVNSPVINEILDQPIVEVELACCLVSSEIVYEPVGEGIRSSNPVINEILDQLLVEVERATSPVINELLDQAVLEVERAASYPVSSEIVDQPVIEAFPERFGVPIVSNKVDIVVSTTTTRLQYESSNELAERRLRGSAVIPSCRCALQCPYCYFSIASVRLLRQHVAFHISFCDAKMTPLFDARFDDVEDGTVADDMSGVVQQCSHCFLQSQLASSDSSSVETFSVPTVSVVADDVNFFWQMGLCARLNGSTLNDN